MVYFVITLYILKCILDNLLSITNDTPTVYNIFFDKTEHIRQITKSFQQRSSAIQNASNYRKINNYSPVASILESPIVQPSLSNNLPIIQIPDFTDENHKNLVIQILQNAQKKTNNKI